MRTYIKPIPFSFPPAGLVLRGIRHRHPRTLILSVRLDLFRAPAGIGIAHVGRRLDRGNEFEDAVRQANDTNNRAGNDAPPSITDSYGSYKDVDCRRVSVSSMASFVDNSQTPRPMKENMKEA